MRSKLVLMLPDRLWYAGQHNIMLGRSASAQTTTTRTMGSIKDIDNDDNDTDDGTYNDVTTTHAVE